MQRTFIALKVEPEKIMVDCYHRIQEALRMEKIKWVDPGNLHITLRFLGDTEAGTVKGISRILEETIPAYPCPEVVFRGMGLFRNLRDPRVLWIGMDTGPVLQELKKDLDKKLSALGFPVEERSFRPHLTLARIKFIRDRSRLEELINAYRDTEFQKNRIEEILYYESFLRQEGPRYLPLIKVSFGSEKS